jgi:hypothetical protein
MDVDGVTVNTHRVPAWEDHVLHVAIPFIVSFLAKNPLRASPQTDFEFIHLEESKIQPIDAAGGVCCTPL